MPLEDLNSFTRISLKYSHCSFVTDSTSESKIKPCVHVCVSKWVHLPEAAPVSRTKPASCPWEMHHWPAAARLEKDGGMEKERENEREEKTLSEAPRINNQPTNRPTLLNESHPTFVAYRWQCLTEHTSLWARQMKGESKIEADMMWRGKTKSRSVIKNPPCILGLCPSSHRATSCLVSMCVRMYTVYWCWSVRCVRVLVSCTGSIHYSKSKYMPTSCKCSPDESNLSALESSWIPWMLN